MPTADGSTSVSGDGGKAQLNDILVLRLKTWTINPVTSMSEWGDSDSNGFTNRARARRDATGSLAGVLDSDDDVWDNVLIGEVLAPLTLHVRNAPQMFWYFPRVLVTSFNLTVDPDTKEVIEWSFDFASDNVFYEPGFGAPVPTIPYPGGGSP